MSRIESRVSTRQFHLPRPIPFCRFDRLHKFLRCTTMELPPNQGSISPYCEHRDFRRTRITL